MGGGHRCFKGVLKARARAVISQSRWLKASINLRDEACPLMGGEFSSSRHSSDAKA